jgi:hypothetical protein
VSAYDIVPTAHQATAPDSAPDLVQISLDQWKGAGFYLTDKEQVEIDKNRHFIPMQMGEAVRSLANAINSHVMNQYPGIYGYVGTAGTTPFAEASTSQDSVADATGARKVLNQQLCPRDMRRGVVDFDAEANMLGLAQFSDMDKIGTNAVRIEGEVGRKYGFDWYTDDDVKTHTNGTAWATGVTVTSTTAAGATSIDLTASATGTVLEGDVFTIAGQTQTYVATADHATGTALAVSIQPPLAAIATAANAVTVKAAHVVNLAFHRDCFALAMRPLAGATSTNPNVMSMTDPQTGITLRLELTRQNKQDKWEFDVLWGAKMVRAALGCRIAG